MKKLFALLLSLTLVLSLAGSALAAQATTLTVACWDLDKTPYYNATKAAFEEANPGVTVEYIDLASQDYNIKLGTMLAGGDTTDVIYIKELSDLTNFAQQGFVENLDERIKASDKIDLSKYVGMDLCYTDTNGSYYALPCRADFWVLYYNKTLFDQAGLAYPTNDMTWEQYKELALKMTSGEGDAKVWGTHHHTWLSAAVNWAVCDGVNTLTDGEYSDLAYFYQMVQGLEDAGACMEFNELKAANLHYSGAFAKGNIAMMPMGYWFVSTLIGFVKDGSANFDWGITAVPHLETVPAGSSFGSPTGVAVNKNAANKDLAWQFTEFLCSQEGAKAFASTGTRPAYVSEEIATAMSSVAGFPADEGSKAALLPIAMALEFPNVPEAKEIKTIINEEHTSIMVRDITIEEGIQNMNERVAEVLGK